MNVAPWRVSAHRHWMPGAVFPMEKKEFGELAPAFTSGCGKYLLQRIYFLLHP
jgi:hypothetical protein